MNIALYHKHYNEQHLETVKQEMQTLGAPVIRCIWSECYEMWMAVEGCHRIRAAKALGITPIIQDITNDETVTIQIDGDDIEVSVEELANELSDDAPNSIIIRF